MNRQIRHNIQEIKLDADYELMLYPVSISDTKRYQESPWLKEQEVVNEES